MRLKQKTKNIIGGVFSAIFVIALLILYQILVVHGKQFEIKNISIDDDKKYLSPVLASYNIAEGNSIFSFDAKETSDIIEEKLHHVRTVDITKELPSDVKINITHRIPVMRLSENLPYVVDENGKIFMASKNNTSKHVFETIPILLDNNAAILKPGDSLGNKAALALNIINKFNSIVEPGFKISHINTSNDIYLIIHSNTNKQIFIAWDELTDDQMISSAIEIAVNAMINGSRNPLSKLIIQVKLKQCQFTKM